MPPHTSHGPGGSRRSTAARWLKALSLSMAVAGCDARLAEDSEPGAPSPALATQSSALQQVTGFGTNPGGLAMYKYVPAGLPANAPLVVALHGCNQMASAYANAGWNELADLWKFAVVYPQKSSGGCFGWFTASNITRNGGEPLSIKQMVDKMKTDHGVDASRVFVTGLSAGGAMTSVMAATWPDVFSGAAIMAGIPYKCTDIGSCMGASANRTPQEWGNMVRSAYPGYSGPYPRVSIWHGSSDFTVGFGNMTELMEQWTNVHGIDQQEDISETVAGYPHKVYTDASGKALVETYTLTGKGHGTAVDPQFKFPGSNVGCGTTGAFILDNDICSTYYAARFFGLDNSDSEPPQVAVTAPRDGDTADCVTLVRTDATDNVGVTLVEFLIDGQLAGSDSTAPYEYAWNTATTTNGLHTVTARAYDAAKNASTSVPVSVTVTCGLVDTTPPEVVMTHPSDGDTLSGTVTVSVTATDDTGVARVELYRDNGQLLGTSVASHPAGPYTFEWNTTSVSEGQHTLYAKAWDLAGNEETSAPVTVTVDPSAATFAEDFSSNGPDNAGWSLTEWSLNADDRTGTTGSQSIHGAANAAFGTATRTASVSVKLGANPRLSYWRKVNLYRANTMASVSFQVVVNAGSDIVVDSLTASSTGASGESTWTRRSNVDLSAFAHQTVTLKFITTATDAGSNLSYARAWVDGITVGPPSGNADTEPPTVNITAPTNGATVTGPVDVTAVASDNVGVTKVEFYVDGSLAATDYTAPFSFTWNTPALANGGHALMAKAYDAAGNIGTDNDTTVVTENTGGATTTASFTSIVAEDGYVKAYADGSSAVVGTLTTPAVGRGTDGKHNRALFSFDTSALPDDARIVRAWLKVTWSSGSGDPWADPAGNTLQVDVKNGTFGAAGTEASDWAAAPTVSDVAHIIKFTSGTQNSTDFSAAGMEAINKTGKTQVKLRFAQDPAGTRYVFLTQGTGAVLSVEYQ